MRSAARGTCSTVCTCSRTHTHTHAHTPIIIVGRDRDSQQYGCVQLLGEPAPLFVRVVAEDAAVELGADAGARRLLAVPRDAARGSLLHGFQEPLRAQR